MLADGARGYYVMQSCCWSDNQETNYEDANRVLWGHAYYGEYIEDKKDISQIFSVFSDIILDFFFHLSKVFIFNK